MVCSHVVSTAWSMFDGVYHCYYARDAGMSPIQSWKLETGQVKNSRCVHFGPYWSVGLVSERVQSPFCTLLLCASRPGSPGLGLSVIPLVLRILPSLPPLVCHGQEGHFPGLCSSCPGLLQATRMVLSAGTSMVAVLGGSQNLFCKHAVHVCSKESWSQTFGSFKSSFGVL